MKRNKQNKIIEIAINQYITTSFAVKLEMLPQEKIAKNTTGESDELLILSNEQDRMQKRHQVKDFGSDLL